MELGCGLAGGEADDGEAGAFGSGNAGWAVFDGATLTGRDTEPAGGGEINFGIGFEVLHGIATNGDFEILREAGNFEDDIDDLLPGTGGDGERIVARQGRDEIGELPVDGAVLTDEPVEVLEFPIMQFSRCFRPGMFREKITEENAVGNPDVILVIHAMGARKAEVSKERVPRLGMQRFAVDQYAVEIEDDGGEAGRVGRMENWKVGRMDDRMGGWVKWCARFAFCQSSNLPAFHSSSLSLFSIANDGNAEVVGGFEQSLEDEGDEADDQCGADRRPEAGDVEARQQPAHHFQHGGVDDKREEAE